MAEPGEEPAQACTAPGKRGFPRTEIRIQLSLFPNLHNSLSLMPAAVSTFTRPKAVA